VCLCYTVNPSGETPPVVVLIQVVIYLYKYFLGNFLCVLPGGGHLQEKIEQLSLI